MKPFLRALCALLLTAATAHAVPVSLRVADANGQPIAGASVSYFDYRDVSAPDSLAAVPDEARHTVQTAPNGTLALDLQGQSRSSRNVDAGQFVLAEPRLGEARITASGYSLRNARLLPGENTITLDAPARLQGIVRDDAGAPINGATVTLLGVEQDETPNFDARWLTPKLGLISATTQSDERWQMEGLPQGYAYIVARAPDREAHYGEFWVHRGDNQAPPLALAPAGSVVGRILDRDGRPLAGVSVDATEYDDPQSDADGRFRVSNVPLGETTLEFASSSANWLGMDEEIKATIPAQGAVVNVGDVKMGAGLLLSGTIRDQSGAALPDLELSVDEKTFNTDANGHFETRAAKPFYYLEIVKNYRKIKDTPDVPDDATHFDLGDVIVERAVNLPLDVRDEDGNAVSQATLKFTSTDDAHLQRRPMFGAGGAEVGFTSSPVQRESALDGAGVFVPSLPAANYKIEGSGLWGIVAPQTATLTLPEIGEKPAPLKIVVRYFAPTWARGRVVDVAGAPVENARVQISAKHGYRSFSAFSDENGDWSLLLPNAATEPTLDKAELAPFTFVRGGEMTLDGAPENNSWKAADIVMARTDVALTGRVVDDKGGAVAGARVSWGDEPKFASVANDDNGNFTIEGLPDAPINVYASDGPSYTQTAATPGVPAEIALPVANKLSDEELEKLWETVSAGEVPRLWPYFEVLGAPRIFEATKRFDAKRDPSEIGGLYNYLDILAQRAITPAQREDAASQGVALLRRFPIAQTGGLGAARIAILAARSDDAEVRAWASDWYDAQKQNQSLDRTHPYYISETLRVATVGALLGRADASDYLSIGLTLAGRVPNPDANYYIADWGAIVSDGDAQWFEETTSVWSPAQQMLAIVGALENVTDVTRARELLSQLEKLSDDPAILEAEVQELKQHPNRITTRQNLLNQGRFQFVTRVARLDAAAALEELEAHVADPDSNDMAFAVARAAIERGQNEIARRALKLGSGATLALLAQPLDPQLAGKMLDEVFQSANVESTYAPEDGIHSIAYYALAVRDIDAGRGRLLLEEQWRRQQAITGDDAQGWQHLEDMHDLAWAMSLYDLPRALQWLGEIRDTRPDAAERADKTRIAILVMALAAPGQRALAMEIGRAN